MSLRNPLNRRLNRQPQKPESSRESENKELWRLWRKWEGEGERKRQRKIRAQVSDTRMRGNVILSEESTGHDVIGNPDSFQLNVTLRINPRFLFLRPISRFCKEMQ